MARLVVQPLWFLGLYLLVVALAPAMLRLHRRSGPAVVVWLGLAAAAVDLAGRLPALDRVGRANFVLVWLFDQQLGFLYADGTLASWPRRAHAAMAVLLLHPLGLTEPTPGTPVWWALRPLWLLVPAALLVPLVALFAWFERPGSAGTAVPGPAPGTAPVALGLVAVVAGILGVAVSGIWPLAGTPGIRLCSLGAGGALLLRRGRLGG